MPKGMLHKKAKARHKAKVKALASKQKQEQDRETRRIEDANHKAEMLLNQSTGITKWIYHILSYFRGIKLKPLFLATMTASAHAIEIHNGIITTNKPLPRGIGNKGKAGPQLRHQRDRAQPKVSERLAQSKSLELSSVGVTTASEGVTTEIQPTVPSVENTMDIMSSYEPSTPIPACPTLFKDLEPIPCQPSLQGRMEKILDDIALTKSAREDIAHMHLWAPEPQPDEVNSEVHEIEEAFVQSYVPQVEQHLEVGDKLTVRQYAISDRESHGLKKELIIHEEYQEGRWNSFWNLIQDFFTVHPIEKPLQSCLYSKNRAADLPENDSPSLCPLYVYKQSRDVPVPRRQASCPYQKMDSSEKGLAESAVMVELEASNGEKCRVLKRGYAGPAHGYL